MDQKIETYWFFPFFSASSISSPTLPVVGEDQAIQAASSKASKFTVFFLSSSFNASKFIIYPPFHQIHRKLLFSISFPKSIKIYSFSSFPSVWSEVSKFTVLFHFHRFHEKHTSWLFFLLSTSFVKSIKIYNFPSFQISFTKNIKIYCFNSFPSVSPKLSKFIVFLSFHQFHQKASKFTIFLYSHKFHKKKQENYLFSSITFLKKSEDDFIY